MKGRKFQNFGKEIVLVILEKLEEIELSIADKEDQKFKETKSLMEKFEKLYGAFLNGEGEVKSEKLEGILKDLMQNYSITEKSIEERLERREEKAGVGLRGIRDIYRRMKREIEKKREITLEKIRESEKELQKIEVEFQECIQEIELVEVAEKRREIEKSLNKLDESILKIDNYLDKIEESLEHPWKLERFAQFSREEIEKLFKEK